MGGRQLVIMILTAAVLFVSALTGAYECWGASGSVLLRGDSHASSTQQATCTNPPKPAHLLQAPVERVVDGDTIEVQLDGKQERIRLIGVDTPEVHQSEKLERDVQRSGQAKETIRALGKQASAFTKQHLQEKRVELELDVQARNRYGRLLAYIWLPHSTLFNMRLVREGYAQVMTIPPNVKYTELFFACQREAREQQRGLWRP